MKYWGKDSYSRKNLAARKTWYSSVAQAYDRARPKYPQQSIDRVVELTQLPPQANILEIGCGPGTATLPFAQLGFAITSLEPNPDFCQLARENCCQYPNVEIINTSFEEWELKSQSFDAILAATSIHWIPPEVAYPKAAKTLKDNGSLILLWNALILSEGEAYRFLDEIYQRHKPSFTWHQKRANHEQNLQDIGQIVLDSGKFKDLVYEQIVSEVTYTVDDYLLLLSTFSQYIQLDSGARNALFKDLSNTIEQNRGNSITLSRLSAFHIARKIK